MKGKVKILVILAFLFLIVIIGSYSYSKYRSGITGEASADVAKWNISVNGCNIVEPDPANTDCFESKDNGDGTVTILRNFNITEFTYNNEDLNNVTRDKIAPGSSGNFKIKIKPNDTEVSIKYTINSHIEDDDVSLLYYIKGPNDSNYISMPSNGYVGYINYNASNTTREDVINFKVVWENNESHNKEDTVIGTKSSDPKLNIPVEILFEQYNG